MNIAFLIGRIIVGIYYIFSGANHNFWAAHDPMQKVGDMVNFTKNMALIGWALMFLAIPQPWPYSVGY